MATIKSFTSLEQSKKLAEILPLESADMYYWCADHYPKEDWIIEVGTPDDNYEYICAWSLATLLDALPKIINNETLFIETSSLLWHIGYRNIYTARADNPIDACYEMILKLKEKNLL